MVNGGFAYGYLFMSQHPDAPKVFKEFLLLVKPNRILEIGTFHGGLTLLLRDILDDIGLTNSAVRTYDIHNQEFLKPLVVDRNLDVITTNLFDDTYNNWINNEAKNEIADYIQQEGVSLVLCDGGCKKCEFNLLAPLLKHNDIILAHDYAPDEEYFNQYIKNKIWDWLEIQDSDIRECSLMYQLLPYQQELMQTIAWCCREKK